VKYYDLSRFDCTYIYILYIILYALWGITWENMRYIMRYNMLFNPSFGDVVRCVARHWHASAQISNGDLGNKHGRDTSATHLPTMLLG
jgi:hypothetical protein